MIFPLVGDAYRVTAAYAITHLAKKKNTAIHESTDCTTHGCSVLHYRTLEI